MFDYYQPKEKEPTDYSGLKVAAALIPVFILFLLLGNADMALTGCIALGMAIFAVKLHWSSRKHIWFWATIILVLALHVPLLFMIRWPQGKTPTIFYTKPLGILDFVIFYGALELAERLFCKDLSDAQED